MEHPWPVVLVHGNPGRAAGFDDLRHRLEAVGIATHAYTLPGFGTTPPPTDGDYSLTAQARWVWAAMDAERVHAAVVLGHSHGGSIALVMAAGQPNRVKGLCLVGSAGLDHGNYRVMGHPVVQALLPAMAWVVDELELDVMLAEGLARWGMGRKKKPVDRDQLMTLPGEIIKTTFRAAAAWDDLLVRRCVTGVRCPTVVIHGTADKSVPVGEARRLARRITQARLLLLPGVGHRPHLEAPDTVVEALSALCHAPQPNRAA